MRSQDPTLPEALFKTIHHFAPEFLIALSKIPDPRDREKITYPLEEEILLGILLFLLKLEARRNLKFELNSEDFTQNIKGIGEIFFPNQKFPDTIPHGDTLNYLLEMIPTTEILVLRTLIIPVLIRKKCFEQYRLFNLYYPVAIDGTGCLTFTKRHCPYCLKRKNSVNKQAIFYHPVLEAKLVFRNGLALSIATEFIENTRENDKKQDCELKAFYRLAKKLKQDFPQLRICLLLDSLYAASPVIEVCKQNHWRKIITFKKGNMKSVYEDYESLKKLSPQNYKKFIKTKSVLQEYSWINDITIETSPKGRSRKRDCKMSAFECAETVSSKTTHFVWLTDFNVDHSNVVELSNEGGRLRWKVENEGFNMQKNGGYGLEHAFSYDNQAMKNFYLLMQIAHIFNQLIEKGSLLRERIKRTMGSLRVFSKKLLASLTEKIMDFDRLRTLLSQRIQVRFDSS